MKKLNIYTVYMDDGKNCFKVTVPAVNKKAASEYVQGNGEIIKIMQNTEENGDLVNIDTNCLADTLRAAQWGQEEINVITRALSIMGLER